MDEERIFHAALQRAPEVRAEFIANECGGDGSLQARVEQLIVAHENPDSIMQHSPMSNSVDATTEQASLSDAVGTQIDSYKLREKIGEGGMGVVYVAEQERPVRRKVALKIIKPGMDSREVIARFEAERQALALMDHPNIAKVLHASSTDAGRPYFVMELVRGVAITDYCDKKKLTIDERLELFVQVCHAVQHAHQKGIIHRDIKPSNVMITEHDGSAVPKVIDFGVAKATNQRLTEQTIYTKFQQIIGTPMYMSPEQAELSGLDIDTRSDIYSLGVLLYELITGVLPFAKERFERASYDEMRKIIRDEEPARPSNKISTVGDSATLVSANRGTDPTRFRRQVAGDLDWIVVKAMEKDRTRRYETADRLAEDIQRYIDDDIVIARPPSAVYRFRKFVTRNKALVATAAAIFSALSIGLIVALVGLAAASKEAAANRRLTQQLSALLDDYREELTDKALLHAFSGDLRRAATVADQLESVTTTLGQKVRSGQSESLLGIAEFYRGNYEVAERHCDQARSMNPKLISAQALLALIYITSDRIDEYVELSQRLPRDAERDELDVFERLFLAHATTPTDCISAARELNSIVAAHPSLAIARGMHAEALAHLATRFNQPEAIEQALSEIRTAKQLAPDTAYLNLIDLWVHLVALTFTDSDDPTYGDLQAAAELACTRQYPHYELSHVLRSWYYIQFGNSEEATLATLEALKRGIWMWVPAGYLQLIGEGKLAEAQLELHGDSTTNAVLIRHLHAAAESSEIPYDIAEIRARLGNEGSSTEAWLSLLELLTLAGRPDLAREEARELVHSRQLSSGDWFNYKDTADFYLSGTSDYGAYIDAHAGKSRTRECTLAYHAGLALIAKGRRAEARAMFNRAIATQQFFTGPSAWSKVFAAKLDDPTWPAWITRNPSAGLDHRESPP